jgi:hypothetical protein
MGNRAVTAELRRRERVVDIAYSREADLRAALWLTYITIGWMTIEGAASLLLGWASKSLLLEAFGIDSVIELFSAGVLWWRLRVEAGGTASAEDAEATERRAARYVGYSLYALVAYVAFSSIWIVHRETHHRYARERVGHSHRLGCEDRNADSRRLETQSRSATTFACLTGGRR